MLVDNIKKTMLDYDIAQINFECNNILKYLISGKTFRISSKVEDSLKNSNQL